MAMFLFYHQFLIPGENISWGRDAINYVLITYCRRRFPEIANDVITRQSRSDCVPPGRTSSKDRAAENEGLGV